MLHKNHGNEITYEYLEFARNVLLKPSNFLNFIFDRMNYKKAIELTNWDRGFEPETYRTQNLNLNCTPKLH